MLNRKIQAHGIREVRVHLVREALLLPLPADEALLLGRLLSLVERATVVAAYVFSNSELEHIFSNFELF